MKKHKLTFLGTIATLLLTMFACTDDDSFSTSAGLRLTFSEDTIFLDTVFSRVPTAAKSFWVFNHSGDGIRCSQVKLEKGNQTGFRVNVDGTYLSSTLGYQTQNVEIRNKDSIRVFVELTSPENGIEGPQLLEDNIVFTMESGVEQKVNLNAYTWDAEILSNLVIKGDTTLGGEKPTVIYGGIRVDSLATLHIPAGKTLYFHAGAGIDVYGKLLVEGSAEQNVILRGDRLDHMFDYLPYDLVSGQWNGIHFFESSYDNRLEYMDLLKCFAIFSVLLGHSTEQLSGGLFWDHPVWGFIYSYHMPLFMFVCGFFFPSSLRRSYGEMALGKLRQLGIPSLTAYAIACLIMLAAGVTAIADLCEWSFAGFMNCVWFLKCLLFCYLLMHWHL